MCVGSGVGGAGRRWEQHANEVEQRQGRQLTGGQRPKVPRGEAKWLLSYRCKDGTQSKEFRTGSERHVDKHRVGGVECRSPIE